MCVWDRITAATSSTWRSGEAGCVSNCCLSEAFVLTAMYYCIVDVLFLYLYVFDAGDTKVCACVMCGFLSLCCVCVCVVSQSPRAPRDVLAAMLQGIR